MLPTDCIRLYDIMKAMKCETYHIFKNMVIGTDNYNTTLSQVFCDTKIDGYITDDNKFVDSYEITLSVMKLIAEKCGQFKDRTDFNPENYIFKYSIRSYGISELMVRYINIASILENKFVPDFKIDDLKSNEEFNQILAKKSSDGMSLFRASKKYMLTLYTGLLPINKSDKAGLEIYNVDNATFISKFIINKGKFIIFKYVNYLYL